MRIAYLVYDLNDAAVARRVQMLEAAGFNIVLAGFYRGDSPPPKTISPARCLDLGRTFDGRLAQRTAKVACAAATANAIARQIGEVEIIVARNLEMLLIATALRNKLQGLPAIVYEALDVHRLLLGSGIAAGVLRRIERACMRRVQLLLTSSPAFLDAHFYPQMKRERVPALVIENKLWRSGREWPGLPAPPPAGPPWRIGWLGMIRCRRSLEFLRDLVRRRPDLVAVEIHGQPSPGIFSDFQSAIGAVPGIHFGGRYRSSDLGKLYGSVHFNWAIDYYEEAGNSELLLPNRIYEGGAFDAVPIALQRTETGHWLERRGLGVRLDNPATELEQFLDRLTPQAFARLKAASQKAPRENFQAGPPDCDRLGEALRLAYDRSRPCISVAGFSRHAA